MLHQQHGHESSLPPSGLGTLADSNLNVTESAWTAGTMDGDETSDISRPKMARCNLHGANGPHWIRRPKQHRKWTAERNTITIRYSDWLSASMGPERGRNDGGRLIPDTRFFFVEAGTLQS
jgi:hypothetical protein